jgi:hypothetical protein
MSDLRIVRSALTATLLFLSMGLAHNFGGAVPKLSGWSLILWVATFIILIKVRLDSISNPALAALVLLFQTLGHVVISAESAPSDIQMSASHLFAGLITFSAIKFGCHAVDVLERGLSRFLPTPFQQILVAFRSFKLLISSIRVESSLDFSRRANQLRAPPLVATLGK